MPLLELINVHHIEDLALSLLWETAWLTVTHRVTSSLHTWPPKSHMIGSQLHDLYHPRRPELVQTKFPLRTQNCSTHSVKLRMTSRSTVTCVVAVRAALGGSKHILVSMAVIKKTNQRHSNTAPSLLQHASGRSFFWSHHLSSSPQ